MIVGSVLVLPFLITLFFNTLSLHSSFSVTDQFLHPYRTKDNSRPHDSVCFFLCYFDSKWKSKNFWLFFVPEFNLA